MQWLWPFLRAYRSFHYGNRTKNRGKGKPHSRANHQKIIGYKEDNAHYGSGVTQIDVPQYILNNLEEELPIAKRLQLDDEDFNWYQLSRFAQNKRSRYWFRGR